MALTSRQSAKQASLRGGTSSAKTSAPTSAPTVRYDTATGKKLAEGQSTMIGGQSVKAGSAYTGPNAYGSGSTKIAYDTKTGKMLSAGATTPYAGKIATEGQDISEFALPQATEAVQPSPTEPKQPTATVPFEQAAELLAAGMKGSSATSIKSAQDAMKQKYYGGKELADASGVQAGATQGSAGSMIQKTLTPPPADTSFIDTALEEDSFMTSLMDSITEFMEPTNQRDTLVKEYERLEKQSGLEGIDKELLDARNIIEGTEDDIRNEVTKAGGFATDSQVQAMTLARNKSLIKNYNNLLETRNNIQSRLDTMMNLTKEDKKMAQEKLASQLDLGFKLQEFKDKAKKNAVDAYQKIVDQVGYAGLQQMTGGDPYYTSLIERSLGLGSGGLAKLALVPDLDRQLKEEQILTERAQRSKIYSDISGSSDGEDISSYVFAYANGQIPLTQVPQKIRGQVLTEVQNSGKNKMLDLLGQYRNKLTGLNLLTAQTPTNKAALGSLKGQITAEYKQQKQLGTLDAGVQTLIDSIIPDPSKPSLSALSNKAQVEALDNFITNQGGTSTSKGPVGVLKVGSTGTTGGGNAYKILK